MKKIGGKFKTQVFYIPKMQSQGVVPGAPSMDFITGQGLPTPPGQGAPQLSGWKPPYTSIQQDFDTLRKYTPSPAPIGGMPLPDKLGPDQDWNDQRPEVPSLTKDQYKYRTPLHGMTSYLPMLGMGAGAAMEQGALLDRPNMGMGIAGGVLSGASQGAMMGGPFGALVGAAVGAGKGALQTGMARQNYDMARQQEYDNMIKQNTLSGAMYQTGGEVRREHGGRIHSVTAKEEGTPEKKSAPMHPYLIAYMRQAFENAAPDFEPPSFSNPQKPTPKPEPKPIPAYYEQPGEVVADAGSYIERPPVAPVERIPSLPLRPFPSSKPDTSQVPIPEVPIPANEWRADLFSPDWETLPKEYMALAEKARPLIGRPMVGMRNGGNVPKYQTDGTVTPQKVDENGIPVYSMEDVMRMDSILRAKQNSTPTTDQAAQEILSYDPDPDLQEYQLPRTIPREYGDVPWGKALLGTAGATALGVLAWKSPSLWKKIKGGLKREKVAEVENMFKFDDTKALPPGKNYDNFAKAQSIIGDKAWHELEPKEIRELQALDPQFSDEYIRLMRKNSHDEYMRYTFGAGGQKGGPGWSAYKKGIRNSGVKASDPDYENIPEKMKVWMSGVDKKTLQPAPLTKREKDLFRYNVLYRKGLSEDQKHSLLKKIEQAQTKYPTVPWEASDVPGTQNIPRDVPAEHYRQQKIDQETRERIGDYYTNAYMREEDPDQYPRLVYESTA